MQKTYALFDFDGTLRSGDSIVSLCLYARERGLCGAGTLARGALAALGYYAGLCAPEKAKQTGMEWIKGRTEHELAALSQRFCDDVLLPGLYPEGLRALRDEQTRGATVLLITASPSFYLLPLRERLGITDVIGTRMALDDAGAYTGEICGENCRGLQKPLRLAEYLAAKGDRLDYETSSAYGDSASDADMLKLCARKYLVNAKLRLSRALSGAEGVTPLRWGDGR